MDIDLLCVGIKEKVKSHIEDKVNEIVAAERQELQSELDEFRTEKNMEINKNN